jgi:hypothetical protein
LPNNIIALEDVLEARKKGLFLKREVIFKVTTTSRYPLGDKTLLLDKNIALEKDGDVPHLLFERNGAIFKHKRRIRPQAFEMIRFLYTMRNKQEKTFKLEEFAERGIVGNKRTASDRIRGINDICAEVDIQPIFHKFPGHKWGLNPNLASIASQSIQH